MAKNEYGRHLWEMLTTDFFWLLKEFWRLWIKWVSSKAAFIKSHLINIFLDKNESSRIIKTNIRINWNVIQKLMKNNDLSLENAIILGGFIGRGGANIQVSTLLTSKSIKSFIIIYKYRFLYVFRLADFFLSDFCMPWSRYHLFSKKNTQ